LADDASEPRRLVRRLLLERAGVPAHTRAGGLGLVEHDLVRESAPGVAARGQIFPDHAFGATTRLRSTPIPLPSISITPPGSNPRSGSRQQPRSMVPDANTSPG